MPRAAWVGVAVVVVLVGAMAMLSWLGSQGTVKVQLGDREAGPYDTERMAEEIAERGPFLLPDASPNRSLDIYIQHLGDDPREGWLAFLARAPGQDDRDCSLTWDGDRFVDPCGEVTFPADGSGLRQFTTRVTGDELYVDFGAGSEG